jgi:cytochrome c oxidase assembly factor CtaG
VKDLETADIGKPRTLVQSAGEAVHMAGSAVVTGGVAAVLLLIAVPVSIGMGLRALSRRLRNPEK